MKHILFYPNTDSILPRSSTEEALKRVETYLPRTKLESFDNLVAIFWEFVTGEIPEEHEFRYGHIWIDALVILAIRFSSNSCYAPFEFILPNSPMNLFY